MDTIYEPTSPAPFDDSVILSPIAISYLLKTAGWAKFLSIIGFILTGFLVLIAFSVGSMFALIARLNPMAAAMPASIGGMFTVIYLIIAAIVFVLYLFLYQFATRTKTALLYRDTLLLDGGIHRLQSFFKMTGIITIIYLAFLALGIVFFIFAISMMPHMPTVTQ